MFPYATAQVHTNRLVRVGRNVFYLTESNPVFLGQISEDNILSLFDTPIGVEPFKSTIKALRFDGMFLLAVARSQGSLKSLRALAQGCPLNFTLVTQE